MVALVIVLLGTGYVAARYVTCATLSWPRGQPRKRPYDRRGDAMKISSRIPRSRSYGQHDRDGVWWAVLDSGERVSIVEPRQVY
jgi:hypothetical protein